MIQVYPGFPPGSESWLFTHPGSRIPYPEVKKAQDPGSRIRIRNTMCNHPRQIVEMCVVLSLKEKKENCLHLLFVTKYELKPNSWTDNFVEVSGHNLERSQTEVSVYNVYITKQFSTQFNPLVEVTVNSKEENSKDFCPNYVQEFCLWAIYKSSVRDGPSERHISARYKEDVMSGR